MTVRLLLSLLVLASCSVEQTPAPAALTPGEVYRSSGDVFARGALTPTWRDLAEGEAEAPAPLRIHAPKEPGTYPIVEFHHGFLVDAVAYDDLLQHLASHGFVVVAPQLYEADGVPLGKPTTFTESELADRTLAWSRRVAGAVMGVATDPRSPGIAGHSRGGKVSWRLLARGVEVRAIAGVDPVDGDGGLLFDDDPSAISTTLVATPPTLVIGMGRGPEASSFSACAPAEDGFRHFFDASPSPAWLVLVPGYGHADMLDEDAASLNSLCPGGPDRTKLRTVVAGLLAAHFRATLQDDPTAAAVLSDAAGHPLPVTVEQR